MQAEWSIGSQEISLTVNLDTHQGAWHQLDMRTIEDDARELDLDDDGGWEWVIEKILHLSGQVE